MQEPWSVIGMESGGGSEGTERADGPKVGRGGRDGMRSGWNGCGDVRGVCGGEGESWM